MPLTARAQTTLQSIDYILHSPGLTLENVSATWELDLGSDHRSVKASFSYMPGHTKRSKQARIKRGWKLALNKDGIASEFHENIDVQMSGSTFDLLNNLQDMQRDAASITNLNDQGPNGTRPEKSMALKTLIYQRRHCRINSQRKQLSKDILKLARQELRKWRTMWANYLLEKFRNTKYLQKVNIDPIHSTTCPIDDDDFADFFGAVICRPSGGSCT